MAQIGPNDLRQPEWPKVAGKASLPKSSAILGHPLDATFKMAKKHTLLPLSVKMRNVYYRCSNCFKSTGCTCNVPAFVQKCKDCHHFAASPERHHEHRKEARHIHSYRNRAYRLVAAFKIYKLWCASPFRRTHLNKKKHYLSFLVMYLVC